MTERIQHTAIRIPESLARVLKRHTILSIEALAEKCGCAVSDVDGIGQSVPAPRIDVIADLFRQLKKRDSQLKLKAVLEAMSGYYQPDERWQRVESFLLANVYNNSMNQLKLQLVNNPGLVELKAALADLHTVRALNAVNLICNLTGFDCFLVLSDMAEDINTGKYIGFSEAG